ncbi:hypothetical protein K2X33_05815 [bacterium]|nr:hypothetical protein [bacterium]
MRLELQALTNLMGQGDVRAEVDRLRKEKQEAKQAAEKALKAQQPKTP